MSLTSEQLDSMICESCGDPTHADGKLLLIARCHPKSGLTVIYSKHTSDLHIECKLCKKYVTSIRVQSERQPA